MDKEGDTDSTFSKAINESYRSVTRKKEFLPRKSTRETITGVSSFAVAGQFPDYAIAHQGLIKLSVNGNHLADMKNSNGTIEVQQETENVYGEIGTDNVLVQSNSFSEATDLCKGTSDYGPHNSYSSTTISDQSTNCSYKPSVNKSHETLLPSAGGSSVTTITTQNYRLRPKRRRHVYHEITLPFGNNKAICNETVARNDARLIGVGSAPPLPFKPHYLRSEFTGDFSPRLPPRILNKDAVLQRKQLTEEYFENIRKSVDIDFENDLVLNELVSPSEDAATSEAHLRNDQGAGPSNLNVAVSQQNSNVYWTVAAHGSNSVPGHSVANIDLLGVNSNLASNHGSSADDIAVHPSPQLHAEVMSSSRIQFLQSLKSLKQCGWYWGNMSWEDAETMLGHRPNEEGVFLLRDSQDPLHILTVTVRSDENTIHHVRIEHTDGKFQLYEPSGIVSRGAADCVRHPNVITFIKLAMKHSRSGTFIYFVKTRNMGEPPVQIRLLTPISRFSCVKSLKYYARFVIRDLVPNESIHALPIPVKLQEYLLQSQYFDPNEDYRCAQIS